MQSALYNDLLLPWQDLLSRGRRCKISPSVERDRLVIRRAEFMDVSQASIGGVGRDCGCGAIYDQDLVAMRQGVVARAKIGTMIA